MIYQLTQKLLAVGDDFTVKDESGREAYYIDGKAFTFGKKFAVIDNMKREVAFVSQKRFSFRPTYRVKRDGKIAAVITKKRMGFRPQFYIDIPGTNDYTIVGDFVGHEYTIKRQAGDAARISKRFFGGTDNYGVDIQSGDPVLILCAVVVIDLVLYHK